MFTYRIRLRGGALHGREFEDAGRARIPEACLVRDGWRYRVVHQEAPDRWVAVPDELMPGPCRWCVPDGAGPSSCSCPQSCDSWRCGRIFPRRDHTPAAGPADPNLPAGPEPAPDGGLR